MNFDPQHFVNKVMSFDPQHFVNKVMNCDPQHFVNKVMSFDPKDVKSTKYIKIIIYKCIAFLMTEKVIQIQTKQSTKCICYILQLRIILPLKLLLSYLTQNWLRFFSFRVTHGVNHIFYLNIMES